MKRISLHQGARTVYMTLDLARLRRRVVDMRSMDVAKYFDSIAQDVHPVVGNHIGLGTQDHIFTPRSTRIVLPHMFALTMVVHAQREKALEDRKIFAPSSTNFPHREVVQAISRNYGSVYCMPRARHRRHRVRAISFSVQCLEIYTKTKNFVHVDLLTPSLSTK